MEIIKFLYCSCLVVWILEHITNFHDVNSSVYLKIPGTVTNSIIFPIILFFIALWKFMIFLYNLCIFTFFIVITYIYRVQSFFLCNSPVCVFIYFLKICNFFGTPMAQKKICEPFFLSKSKVQKSKNVYINYFYRNKKIFKD